MFIGDKTCFLRIERDDQAMFALFRMEACLVLDGEAEFRGLSTAGTFSTSPEDRRALLEFSEFRAPSWTVAMSDGGSLELRRDLHGTIEVRFAFGYERGFAFGERIGPHWKLAGEVRVEGEYAQRFLRELDEVLFARP
ncbi:MAG TPA: hypothetical protein VKQ32_09665 [Polyangia bacterium]|nr:hypothetical protein [Polyangia bacterium]